MRTQNRFQWKYKIYLLNHILSILWCCIEVRIDQLNIAYHQKLKLRWWSPRGWWAKRCWISRQCSSSIVFAYPPSSPMISLFSSPLSQQYLFLTCNHWKTRKKRKKTKTESGTYKKTKLSFIREKYLPGPNWLFCSLLHAIIPCCCRLIRSLATWRAAIFGVVGSGITPMSAWNIIFPAWSVLLV